MENLKGMIYGRSFFIVTNCKVLKTLVGCELFGIEIKKIYILYQFYYSKCVYKSIGDI